MQGKHKYIPFLWLIVTFCEWTLFPRAFYYCYLNQWCWQLNDWFSSPAQNFFDDATQSIRMTVKLTIILTLSIQFILQCNESRSEYYVWYNYDNRKKGREYKSFHSILFIHQYFNIFLSLLHLTKYKWSRFLTFDKRWCG